MKVKCEKFDEDLLSKNNFFDEDFDCTIPEPDIKVSCYSRGRTDAYGKGVTYTQLFFFSFECSMLI